MKGEIMGNVKVIKTGWLICSSTKVMKHAVLVTEGNRIKQIFTEKEWKKYEGREDKRPEILDKSDSIVFPGFINAHMHQYGILSHGIPQVGKVTDFRTFLTDYWWPYIEDRIRKEEVLITAEATMAEMICSGVTAFCDILEAPYTEKDTLLAQGELIEKAGMRGVVSLECSERISRKNAEECHRQNLDTAEYFLKKQGLVKGAVCTHTTFTCSEELIRKAVQDARKGGHIFQFHLSESAYEPQWLKKNRGKLPVCLYKEIEALGPSTIATQCVKVTENELVLLKENKAKVVHMPVSNCEVGGGIAPVPRMLEISMEPALGTDGYINDFFLVMKEAFLIHKAALESAEVMPARQVFRMATEFGARTMGLFDCGVLEPGKKADLVVYKENQPTPVTEENIYDQLVVFGNSANVTDVLIDGAWVMKDRKLQTIDRERAAKRVRQCARKFWKGVRDK